MKITKDINIETENLIKNSKISINYSGKLCNSSKVFLYYGTTANNFEYKKEELQTNNGIKSIEINIEKPGYFYFYFEDENKNLDNNSYKDYQLYIKQSNLVFTDNSSMKELPYKRVLDFNQNYGFTYYTPQTIKNTSRPQEIIIPRPFNSSNATENTKVITGFTIEPIKEVKNFDITQALIPTDTLALVTIEEKSPWAKRILKFNNYIHKLLLCVPKLFEKT